MDYFNDYERAKQREFSALRDRALAPLTRALAKRGVAPNHVTALGVGCLIAACLIGPADAGSWWWPWLPTALLCLYCALDGLDGPLARHLKRTHDGGAIVEIAADQLGVVLVPAAAIYHLGTDPVWAILFSNGYICVIALVVYFNTVGIRVPPYLRVKYPLYIAYGLSFGFAYNLVEPFLIVFSVYYGLMVMWAVSAAYRHFDRR